MVHFFSCKDFYDSDVEQVYVLLAKNFDEPLIVFENFSLISVEFFGNSLLDFEIDDDFSYNFPMIM